MSTVRTTGSAAVKREAWGSLRKLPSGRWQARYPAPDGETYTARTENDKPLTFLTKTDARTWLAGVHTKIARQEWEPPSTLAARRRVQAAAEKARSVGFSEYSDRWITMMRTEPKKNGKHRAVGTVHSYKGKVDGYLVPEFGDLSIREIDARRIRALIERLDDGGAILHVRRQLSANTGDYSSELKREAGKRSLAVPRLMLERLKSHLRKQVAPEAKAPLVPTNVRGSVPLSNTRWGYLRRWHSCRSHARGSSATNSRSPSLLRGLLLRSRHGGHSGRTVLFPARRVVTSRDRLATKSSVHGVAKAWAVSPVCSRA